jgi:hypothetical protein
MSNKVLKFIEKANKRHGFLYDYSKVEYQNSKTKVEVICKTHGSFFVRPDAHVRKVGCPNCKGGIKYSLEDFIERARTKHGDFFIYDKVEYIDSKNLVLIKCPNHGYFKMSPRNHLVGQSCPSCSGVFRKKTEEFKKECFELWGELYSYELVEYTNNRTNVQIICKKHGIFSKNPKDHLNGGGCQKCKVKSKGESEVESILNGFNLEFVREFRNHDCLSVSGKKLPFDFWVPSLNLLIEYDGIQHFKPVSIFGGETAFNNLVANDLIRDEWSKSKGINLIRVSKFSGYDDLIRLLESTIMVK